MLNAQDGQCEDEILLWIHRNSCDGTATMYILGGAQRMKHHASERNGGQIQDKKVEMSTLLYISRWSVHALVDY